ncbi:hypothetical protein cypCar_00037950, partial [Cyprinus carpio]
GHEVQVQSTGGNVTGLQTIHGNVNISTFTNLNGGTHEERWIKATAEKGAVNLRTQSWLETLRLGAQS